MPRMATLNTSPMYKCPLPGFCGSLVNQITRYRPGTELLMRKVTVPLTPFAEAIGVMELRLAALRVAELPTSSFTSAPGSVELKVTTTDRKVTAFAISIMRPDPALSRPKSGVLYHCEAQYVWGLPSIAYFANWLFSLPRSFLALVRGSKPVAFTGTSGTTEADEPFVPGCLPPAPG